MALLSEQTPSQAGTDITFAAAAAGGDTFRPGDTTSFRAKNASTAAKTLTFNSIRPCDQGADHDLVVSVPAGGERDIGPFPAARFAGPGGLVSVTYSAVDSLTVAVVTR